jgi:hypothetical protein
LCSAPNGNPGARGAFRALPPSMMREPLAMFAVGASRRCRDARISVETALFRVFRDPFVGRRHRVRRSVSTPTRIASPTQEKKMRKVVDTKKMRG